MKKLIKITSVILLIAAAFCREAKLSPYHAAVVFTPQAEVLLCVLAILIGGASVNKATIMNVIVGTILFQGIVTMTPTVMNNMVHMDMSEVIRIIASMGMILFALTRKTEASR